MDGKYTGTCNYPDRGELISYYKFLEQKLIFKEREKSRNINDLIKTSVHKNMDDEFELICSGNLFDY